MAAAPIAAIVAARSFGLRRQWVYVTLGVLGWYAFYKAGIHPTLIGVVLGNWMVWLMLLLVVVLPVDPARAAPDSPAESGAVGPARPEAVTARP